MPLRAPPPTIQTQIPREFQSTASRYIRRLSLVSCYWQGWGLLFLLVCFQSFQRFQCQLPPSVDLATPSRFEDAFTN